MTEKRFIIDPTCDLAQRHSFMTVMATLVYKGFDLCQPVTMLQDKEGVGNIVFTQTQIPALKSLL